MLEAFLRRTLVIVSIVGIGISFISLGGCGFGCAGWHEFEPSSRDVLTDGTAKQMLAHNEFGAKQGCWKAR